LFLLVVVFDLSAHDVIDTPAGTLATDEQRQLREILDAMLIPVEEDAKHKALRQALRAAGLITQVRQPRVGDMSPRRRINVPGQPVSETIIAERR
jgi:hypothetical protein